MRPPRLSTLLLGLNAGLVLLAVVCMAVAAVHRLERLADEQALARVTLAAQGARAAVARSGADLDTAALLLAERPTLRRLVREGDSAGLAAFLDRFRRTSHLTGCAVLLEDRMVSAAGTVDPGWLQGDSGQGWRVVASEGETGGTAPLALVAAAPLAGDPQSRSGAGAPLLDTAETRVVVGLVLDDAYARAISGQVGLPIALLAPAAGGELGAVALAEGTAAARLAGDTPETGRYVALVPVLPKPSGEVPGEVPSPGEAPGERPAPAALIQATLPTAQVTATLDRLVRSLLGLAVVVAALALLSGLALARSIGRPVEALTAAAARIGRGDLATPLPPAGGGAEVGTLGSAMEEMRRRLLGLTAELRRRQAEAEAVLTGITEGVFAVDRDRRIRYLNPQAGRLLGVAPEEALGRFCGDVLRPREPDGTRPCDDRCPIVHARFRGGAQAVEHLQLPDGEHRAVVITSSPPAEDRQFQVLRDETETEATRRLRDTVLANISHEFRTPLAAQLASIELLRDRLDQLEGRETGGTSQADQLPGRKTAGTSQGRKTAGTLQAAGDEAARQLVTSLERGTLRLTQLIDNLLESVRIESGEDRIRRRPVALDEVVEQAVEMTAPLLEQRGQRVSVELPYPLPAVLGDAPRLCQVFVNLLANAHKFAPAGTAIRIGGQVEAAGVSLWVEDEGPGLPPGGIAFERFVRSPGEEPEESGMGLGLWIVKSIVERHGGRVAAEPAGEGEARGTRLRVVLPLPSGAATQEVA